MQHTDCNIQIFYGCKNNPQFSCFSSFSYTYTLSLGMHIAHIGKR